MNVKVNSIIALLTIIDSDIYVITKNNKLINIPCFDELELINKKYILNNFNILNINLKQCYTFSEKKDDTLYISILFIDIINNDINLNNDYKLIKLSSLTYNKYIEKLIEFLKIELSKIDSVKKIYKDEFSLPEMQKLYENLFDKKFDRRNFRKKLVKSNLVESLDKKVSKNGRPAKLYKFKDDNSEVIL